MELREIKKIIELMKQNELTEFELQEEEFRISLKRGNGFVVAPQPALAAPASGASPTHEVTASELKPVGNDNEANGLVEIKSPIVGTYYRSPTPDSDPFISTGQNVDEDTVVCIVEAMKVMNDIKAEIKGTIRKILVENGTPVEFDQPLFLVEPA